MLIRDVLAVVEAVAPPAYQAAWDKSGVQVASPRTDIGAVALALDPTPESVRRAADCGAGLLLTHHPLALEPRLPDRLDAFHAALAAAIKADMWLYAAHTSLDVQPAGPAGWLAAELGLERRRVLDPTALTEDGAEIGYGLVGDLPAPMAPDELCRTLARLAPAGLLRRIGDPPAAIARLAYCTGSGATLAKAARAAGADVFVTGDVRYHAALEALDLGLCLIDVGHFSLEEEMTRRLAALLAGVWADGGPAVEFLAARDPFTPCMATHPGDNA